MANKVFCSNCGAGYAEGVAYCPMCGVTVSQQPVTSFNRAHQAHCIACGAKTGQRDTYCAACGAECDEYIPVSGVAANIMGTFGDGKLTGGFSGITGGVKDFAPNLAQMKDRAIFVPAVIFALVSIAVGIILSFLIDGWIGSAVKTVMEGAVEDIVGYGVVDMMSFKLGPITTWLLTCFGGLGISVRSMASGDISNGNASLALGVVILAIVPVVSLIVGRLARKAFINSQYPGKSIRAIDGLCAAVIFAVVNVILSFFPSGLGNALNQAVSDGSYGASVRFSIGARVIPLFLFSLAVAFILALPSLKEIAGSIRAKNKTAGLSCAAGAGFARLALLCGFISAVIVLAYSYIKFGDAQGITGMTDVYVVIVLLFNLAVWLVSFFTGGALSVSGLGTVILPYSGAMASVSIGALGARVSNGLYSENAASWIGGILLLVAGLWIAVTVLYKLLRGEQLSLQTVIGVIAVPAVVMWIISSCATIGVSAKARGMNWNISMSLSSATFVNLIMCAVFMALAVGVVYFSKKSQQLDNIVAKLATLPFACAATAAATLVTCLTFHVPTVF